MKRFTVGYIKRGDKFLFIFRNKKENDINKGKFIGVGGKFEKNESSEKCIIRETKEETGLTVLEKSLCGKVIYTQTDGYSEEMDVYLITKTDGELNDSCNEGELFWLTKEEFLNSPHWVGDEYFLSMVLDGKAFGEFRFLYDKDKLLEIYHNGKRINI